MAISDKSRKLLWGRSGNRCAICRRELAIDLTTNSDESIVGDECHIHSEQKNGPRYDENFPIDKINSYNNLILLCKNHHKMIDDQFETYTAKLLRIVKLNHEKWVKEKLNEIEKQYNTPSIKRIDKNIPKLLIRIKTGKELLHLLVGTYGFNFDYDNLDTEEEYENVRYFFQLVEDYTDIYSDFEIGDKIKTAFIMDKEIKNIEDNGFYIFGARENQLLVGGTGPAENWPIFHLYILKKTNPEIIKFNNT